MTGVRAGTRRLTVAQALVEFLGRQYTVDDGGGASGDDEAGGTRVRTVAGVFGIFGHGNLPGLGQALEQSAAADPALLPFHQARNEQAMVHQAVGYARVRRRRSTLAATASVGPGAANLLTGAALATANRLPVLLLVSDTFATRPADPVLQQLEHPHAPGLQVADAFAPLSRFFARVDRPEQLIPVALAAMRVLSDPAETGAVTIVLPEDVQTEAFDVPESFLAQRDWHLRRPVPEPGALARAAAAIRAARRPLIVAGGGVFYSGAEAALRGLAEATGIPVATTQAGGGTLAWDHPLALGGLGATGSAAANAIAARADLVIGIGTRYSDFTTASGTAFADPDAAFVNVNVAPVDAYKLGTRLPVVADARGALTALTERLRGHRVAAEYAAQAAAAKEAWDATVSTALAPTGRETPGQPEILGAVRGALEPRDVIVAAAGSLPGDLQKLWRPVDPLGYHVEYAFSCMGYEIAGGLGAKRGLRAAGDDRVVVVLVGDGGYQMLHSELATAAAEGWPLVVLVVDNSGYASIGRLSESVGSARFGTRYAGDVDFPANARSYGCRGIDVPPGPDVIDRLREVLAEARAEAAGADRGAAGAWAGPTVIRVRSDPHVAAPDGGGWWDVPVAQVADSASVRAARTAYESARRPQRPASG